MWISSKIFDLLVGNKADLEKVREDNLKLRVERDFCASQVLKLEADKALQNNTIEWLRVQVNTANLERSAFLEKVADIRPPVPELSRSAPTVDPSWDPKNFQGFDDMGDELAEENGYPRYDLK